MDQLKTLLLEDESCTCDRQPRHRHLRVHWLLTAAFIVSLAAMIWLMRRG